MSILRSLILFSLILIMVTSYPIGTIKANPSGQQNRQITDLLVYITTECLENAGTDSDWEMEIWDGDSSGSHRLAILYPQDLVGDENEDCQTDMWWFDLDELGIYLYENNFPSQSLDYVCVLMRGSDAWLPRLVVLMGYVDIGNNQIQMKFLGSMAFWGRSPRPWWSNDTSEGELEVDLGGGTCPQR